MIEFSSISPDEYKDLDKFKIIYGLHPSPFGKILLGLTESDKAICHLWFIDDNFDDALKIMQDEWPGAQLIENQKETEKIAQLIFNKKAEESSLRVLLKGTDFQVRVWKALPKIPRGTTVTYSEVAVLIGNPKAIRAAAKVVAINRIAYVVPCHRVFPKGGNNKYRWSPQRKIDILEWEKKMNNN